MLLPNLIDSIDGLVTYFLPSFSCLSYIFFLSESSLMCFLPVLKMLPFVHRLYPSEFEIFSCAFVFLIFLTKPAMFSPLSASASTYVLSLF